MSKLNAPLLKWGIEHSDAETLHRAAEEPSARRFDPELVEMILGKDDAVRIKEAVSVILDNGGGQTLEERLDAFELLQDLVEQIDNANDMARMHLWDGVVALLEDGNAVELKVNTLRLIAICAKDNPETLAFFAGSSVPSRIIALLREESASKAVFRKSLMAMSALSTGVMGDAFDRFMEEESAPLFEAKLSLFEGEEKSSVVDQILFLYFNYCGARAEIPACLQHSTLLFSLFREHHLERCDDLECPLPLEHRFTDNSRDDEK